MRRLCALSPDMGASVGTRVLTKADRCFLAEADNGVTPQTTSVVQISKASGTPTPIVTLVNMVSGKGDDWPAPYLKPAVLWGKAPMGRTLLAIVWISRLSFGGMRRVGLYHVSS